MEQENNNFVNIIHGYRNKMPFRLDRKIIYVLNRTGAPSAYDNSVLEGILHKGYEAAFLENTFQDESFVDVVQYYLPFLQIPQNQPSTSFNHSEINDELDCPVHLIFHSDSDNLYVSAINSQADVVAFLANLSSYQDENTSGGVVLFSPYISYEEPLPFDSATQESIDKITDQLQKLNETGQFLNILPFIENELQKYKNAAHFPVSDLYIDDNYRIFLKDYNSKEVKLSHLSKSIYFLFLIKEKIHLNEFADYKSELLTIYKHVSNQENLQKMETTISNLVLNENKELYVHFSRIKSAFCSVICDDFAKNYYIKGEKGMPKKINLNVSKSNISDLYSEFFPDEDNSLWIRDYFDGIF